MKLASTLQQAVITSESGASDASRSRNIVSLHVVLSSNSVAAFPSCLAPTLHAISLKRLARRASHDRLTKRQQERLRAAFTAHEAHISVEVAYLLTQQVRDVFHQATPAQGQRLATHLIESLPTCPIPEITRLGRTPRKWKDAFLAYFDTGGASNGPTEAINGHYRTRQTHRQRLPQPHQPPTPNAPHRRRPRRLHPHSTLKSRNHDGSLPAPCGLGECTVKCHW